MKYYIPFVLAVAAAVALISADINKAIAILVVSCPCGQMLVSSAPMIASLGKGKVKIALNGTLQYFEINGGVAKVSENEIIVLAD